MVPESAPSVYYIDPSLPIRSVSLLFRCRLVIVGCIVLFETNAPRKKLVAMSVVDRLHCMRASLCDKVVIAEGGGRLRTNSSDPVDSHVEVRRGED